MSAPAFGFQYFFFGVNRRGNGTQSNLVLEMPTMRAPGYSRSLF